MRTESEMGVSASVGKIMFTRPDDLTDRLEPEAGGRRALRVGRTRSNSSQPPLLGRYVPAWPLGLRIARNLTSGAGMYRS